MIKKHPRTLFATLAGCLLLLAINIPMALAAPAIPATDVQLSSLSPDQLQQAAEAGDPDAQYALGYMYYYGKNVPQDMQQGMNWIKRAAVQGQDQAVKALAMIKPALTSEQQTTPTASAANQPVKATAPAPANQNAPVATNQVQVAAEQPEPSSLDNAQSITPPRKATTPAGSGAERLRNAPSSDFTIQLLASASKSEMLRYIQTNALDNQAMYYQTQHNGHDWYVLVYGLYKTRADAQAALQKLPASVRAKQPWIKAMTTVKAHL